MPGYFTPATFAFLRDLAANNDKRWWDENKDRYVTSVREPALDFIVDFGEKLGTISPHFRSDTSINGSGSLMRPYRDVRFSKDKTPYKANVGIQFRHEAGRDVHAPGFYLHLEPSRCFAGAGLWTPPTAVARQIRRAISDDPPGWSAAAHGKSFEENWSLGEHDEDRLRRVPTGLDPNHPYADDLRLKSFVAGTRLTQREVTSSEFTDTLLKSFKETAPLTRFLCEAIGVPF
jgi:uncharacterized protein (TIGR02453 family)